MRNLPTHYQNNTIGQYQDTEYIILPDSEDISEKSIFDYIKLVKKRKLLFLFPTFLIFPLVIFYIMSQRSVYEAQLTLLINQESENIIPVEGIAKNDISSAEYLNTQYEIIKSRPIAENVVKKLKLHERPPLKETPFETKMSGGGLG